MSVLAHVVVGGSLQSEPAATQALAYILNRSPDIARAFIGMLREANIEFEPGHIKAELGHEDSRPDLTIHDADGRVRVFVENKFWAGLTDAQPVSYLRDLPKDPPSALVFVVPEQRATTVWNEPKVRPCSVLTVPSCPISSHDTLPSNIVQRCRIVPGNAAHGQYPKLFAIAQADFTR